MSAHVGEKPNTKKRMIVMVLLVVLVIAMIAGIKALMIWRMVANAPQQPPAVVSTVSAMYESWQPSLAAVGTLRAVRGVDLAPEVAGVVSEVALESGASVRAGDILVKLRDADDAAKLTQLEASLHLTEANYERARKQLAVKAIPQADYDTAESYLEQARADVAVQAALLAKKTIRAPFDGTLGISTINPGEYVNAGEKIVTLQEVNPIYADFFLPQRDLGQLHTGDEVVVSVDAFAGRSFKGIVSAISPKVDPATRNVMLEASIPNPDRMLAPGMFANLGIKVGDTQHYLTLPLTAVVNNPYGESVYVVRPARDVDKKEAASLQRKADANAGRTTKRQSGAAGATTTGGNGLVVQQVFVTTGHTRGDQVAILSGIDENAVVVSSGQVKLKSGSPVTVDNSLQPPSDPNAVAQDL